MPLFGDFGQVFNLATGTEQGGEDLLLSAVMIGGGAAIGGPMGAAIGASLAGGIVGQRQQRIAKRNAEQAQEQSRLETQAMENKIVSKQFQQRKAQLSPGQEYASNTGTVLTPQTGEQASILG